MTGFKQCVVAILLAASMVLAAEAYAKPPRLCTLVGCSEGPDTCMTMHLGFGSVEISLTCYAPLTSVAN